MPRPPQTAISVDVLVASRTPLLADALRDLVHAGGNGWQATVVDNPDALVSALTPAPRLIVLCSSMGGPELARTLVAAAPQTPFVVMIDGHEGTQETWPGAGASIGLRASGVEILAVLTAFLPT